MPEDRHVVPAEAGGWVVTKRGSMKGGSTKGVTMGGDIKGSLKKRGSTKVVTKVNRKSGGKMAGVTEVFGRKRDAERAAKDEVRHAGGGKVVLHSLSGRITEVDAVTPVRTDDDV